MGTITILAGKDAKMLARHATAVVLVIGALLVGGCSEPPAPAPEAEASVSPPPSTAAVLSNPISATAYEFLDAVFAGDTERADRQLTPAAAQQLAISGQRFAPPGSGPTSFAIGEVRQLDENHAAVECLVRGELEGQRAEEALGCLLKRINGRWGVSGIAYEVSADEPPTVFNFEQLTPARGSNFMAESAAPGTGQPARTAARPGGNVTQ